MQAKGKERGCVYKKDIGKEEKLRRKGYRVKEVWMIRERERER